MSGYVVGVDGSAQSSVALDWALKRASRDRQPVRLVLVIDDEAGLVGEDYALDAERAGLKTLATATAGARERYPDLEITSSPLLGSVPWELSHAATSADVLVIGTHRAGPSAGTVLGSRSVQVASITPALLAVIPAVPVDESGPVVAGVSMRERGGSAVLHAAAEAAASGRDLLLVLAAVPAEPGKLGDAHTALAHTALAEAKAVAVEVHPGLTVSTEFVTADPAEALLDAASRHASMVVLGPSRTFGSTGSPIGTVTQSMLLNAPCPVLVTRYSSV